MNLPFFSLELVGEKEIRPYSVRWKLNWYGRPATITTKPFSNLAKLAVYRKLGFNGGWCPEEVLTTGRYVRQDIYVLRKLLGELTVISSGRRSFLLNLSPASILIHQEMLLFPDADVQRLVEQCLEGGFNGLKTLRT